MSDLSELIERVKVATGPDWELNKAISGAVGWKFIEGDGDNRPDLGLPAFTDSNDAALALVVRCLPGAGWYVERGVAKGVPATVAALYPDLKASEPIAKSDGETPALAILSALLLALAETEKDA